MAAEALSNLHASNQFLNFLRHHDELALDLLTEEEYKSVVEEFAPQEDMLIYDRGIRRRLPPMLNNDTQRLKLSFSLMFSLPGVPMIRYGDEIGMGENLQLNGRNSVRTAMQWTDSRNGGFSSHEGKLFHSVISKGEYSYSKVNVAKEQNDEHSFLNWVERLIAARKQCAAIAKGNIDVIEYKTDQLFMHVFNHSTKQVLFIHNLSDQEVVLEKDEIPSPEGGYYNFFVDPKVKHENDNLIVNPYGYLWLKSFL